MADTLSFFPLSLFSAEMSGTGEEISQVHWKQQWLENGTLYFHVSMTESEILAQTTRATAREPAHGLHEHMLHISVMVSYKQQSLTGNVVVNVHRVATDVGPPLATFCGEV